MDTAEKAASHEQKCSYNLANKTCATCKNLDWPKNNEQHEAWQEWDDTEEDYVMDKGCHAYNDKTYREHCEKWEEKGK